MKEDQGPRSEVPEFYRLANYMEKRRRKAKWWHYGLDEDGRIALSFGPGDVNPPFVSDLHKYYGAYNIRLRFCGPNSTKYDEYPLARGADSLWEKVKQLKAMLGERGWADRSGYQKQVTLHVNIPPWAFEAFFRYIYWGSGEELPGYAKDVLEKATKTLKEASP